MRWIIATFLALCNCPYAALLVLAMAYLGDRA